MARNRETYEEPEETAAPELTCWLCERAMGAAIEWHHPIPKSRGGRAKVPVHPICHQTIHQHFTTSELGRLPPEPAPIRERDAVARFLEWVANKPADFHAPTKGEGKRR
ncbi:MAG: HNH endonuclease [Sphingobium sp.]